MAGPARITQADLERFYEPALVRQLFTDNGQKTPGPRLAANCLRASRLAEAVLLRAWPSLEQIDALFAEDDSIVAITCSLCIACAVEGKTAWTGQGAPFEGLYKRCMSELRERTDGELRSRAEQKGAGQNPTITGSVTPTQCPTFMFASTAKNPRRGGY